MEVRAKTVRRRHHRPVSDYGAGGPYWSGASGPLAVDSIIKSILVGGRRSFYDATDSGVLRISPTQSDQGRRYGVKRPDAMTNIVTAAHR